MTGQQIYETFHTSQGPDSLQTSQQSALNLAGTYQDRAASTQKIIDGVKAAWTGNAADEAAQGLAPLAENTLQTGEDLNTSQDLIYRQSASFHAAKAQVQSMPAAPQMQNSIVAIAEGQSPASMVQQQTAYNGAGQSNVDAYNNYVEASQYNASGIPDVSTPMKAPPASVSVAPPTPQGSAKATAGVSPAPSVPGGSGGTGSARNAGSPSAQGTTAPPTGPAGPGSTATTTSSASPTSTINPNPVVGSDLGIGSGGGSSGTPGGNIGPIGDSGSNIAARLSGGGSDAGSGGVEGLSSGGRSGSSLPGQGPAEEGTGNRSGAGAGDVAEENGTEAGTAGARGASGTSAGGMGAGRGGKGDPDAEHKRKYQYGDDPEELYGVTDKVAPPVIGETPHDYQQRLARDAESGRHRK
jgi:hypothetical protein